MSAKIFLVNINSAKTENSALQQKINCFRIAKLAR
jgi:hypothetical protein